MIMIIIGAGTLKIIIKYILLKEFHKKVQVYITGGKTTEPENGFGTDEELF